MNLGIRTPMHAGPIAIERAEAAASINYWGRDDDRRAHRRAIELPAAFS
jgi:hypothetical protein